MADITNRQVIAASNELLRPMAERLRDLNVLIDDFVLNYNNVVSPALSGNANADVIVDGRDGIAAITKADYVNFVTQCQTIQTQFNGVGVMDVLTKPVVRPLRVG